MFGVNRNGLCILKLKVKSPAFASPGFLGLCLYGKCVNVLKFLTLFSFCSQKYIGSQGWNLQNSCQNSKQEDPDQTASSEAF